MQKGQNYPSPICAHCSNPLRFWRLQKLREWVRVQPQFKKKLVLLDFDALSKMKHAPTPLEGLDWHFQCIFNFEVRRSSVQRRF